MKLTKTFIKSGWKHQCKVVILSLIVLISRKINLKHGIFIDSPDWIKNYKVTINPINYDYKCFPFAATFPLNHDEIGKNFQRLSKIKLFIIEKNNPATAVYKCISSSLPPYTSKHNSKHEKQTILLII